MGFLSKFFYALLALLVLLHTRLSLGTNGEAMNKCIARERKALLLFKHGIYADSDMLSTWREGDDEDCCNWKGVYCSKQTGHVQILDLHGSDDYPLYLRGTINITLLSDELHDLKHLDLSYNDFYQSDIPKSIELFTNLRYLNLSYSDFVGAIPYQLGKLSNLRYIDLSSNRLEGGIPWQIGNLSKLQYLNLENNHLVGVIPYQLGNLSLLHTLKFGGHGSNLTVADKNNRNAEWISELSSLANLDLSYVSDVGHSQMIGKLVSKLRELRLRGCGISYTDNFPLFASPLNYSSSLVILDLSYNNLNSLSLFQWLFNFSSSLQELYLINCNLSTDNLYLLFSHSHFPSLTLLDLSNNNLNSSLFHQWSFNLSSNLQELYLKTCSLSANKQYFLPSLSHFPSLTVVDLSYNNLNSSLFHQWTFNSSSSSSLQELYLQNCSLSANNQYFLPSHSYFPSLTILDLSYNNMSSVMTLNFGSNLQQLYLNNCSLSSDNLIFTSFNPNLTSLVHLDLSFNLLTSSTIFYWISNFTFNLREVYLNDNTLSSSIPDSFGDIMNSLQVLDLSFISLQGRVPTTLGNICTLKSLYLGRNNLSGDLSSFISNASLCSRHPLQRLSLEGNRLTGILPNLSVFPFLQELDISNNQLTRIIPESFGSLSQLKYLWLSDNNLGGIITESHFKNLSNLLVLSLSRNSLTLKISTSWIPPFYIQYMYLASCMIGPNFPNWLRNQHQLSDLDISDGRLSGFIPEWFWPLLENMFYLNISYNNFIGEIPNLPLKFNERPRIILTSNNFEGVVPPFFWQASKLDVSKNKFSNLIPLLCTQTEDGGIVVLDLSNNQLKGNLPNCWSQLNSLKFVNLSNNNLSGEIPSSIGDLVNMEALVLGSNNLIGKLPSSLMNCSKLLLLDVSKNKLSGSIPSWIGENLRQLEILSLRMNHLNGSLPMHLCHLTHIRLLDLSHNKLSNEIPSCLENFIVMTQKLINLTDSYHSYRVNVTSYSYNYESLEFFIRLTWKGEDQMFKRPELFLKSIDLSNNALTGEIPKELVSLLGLVSLNLSRNQLSGEIPINIGNLESLEFLDLSKNKLSGSIPPSLAHIDRLSVLDLSSNSLSGKIPTGTQLQGFNASSYEGNLDLCGLPLNKTCLGDNKMPPPQEASHDEEEDDSLFSQEFYLSMGLGFFVGFWAFVGPLLFNQTWRQGYYRFLNTVTYKVHVMVAIYVVTYLTNRD